ncbi:MAG: hypothetical protein ACYSSP_10860, partial [Planctomycetota bacterium]
NYIVLILVILLASTANVMGAPKTPPVLINPLATSIDTTSAFLGANITDQGSAAITDRGTTWGTSAAPTGNYESEGGTAVEPFQHQRTGLTAGTHYYFRGYAANGDGQSDYSPDGEFYTEPTEATSADVPAFADTTMTITWTAGGGDGAIVIMKESSVVDSDPVDGTPHNGSTVFKSGDQLGTGNYVVYRGPYISQVDVTSLTAGKTYYISIYEYAGSGSLINYQQDGPATFIQATTGAQPSLSHNDSYAPGCNKCHSMHVDFIPRGQEQSVVCKQCHQPTGEAAQMADVNNHIVDVNVIIDCGSCHDVHIYDFNTPDTHSGGVTAENIKLIRWDTAKYITDACEPALFQQSPAHFAFGDSNPPWNGICQSCHLWSATMTRHTNEGLGDNNHEIGGNCTSCHSHKDGFLASGSCIDCHDEIQDENTSDGIPARRAVVGVSGDFIRTSHHVVGGTVTDDDCAVCHYESVDAGYHKNGQIDLRDPDTGSALTGFVQFTRNTSSDVIEPNVVNVQNNLCMKCHDANGAVTTAVDPNFPLQPFSSNTRDAPNIFAAFDTGNAFHHAVRGAGSNPYCIPSGSNGSNITMVSPWNQDSTHDVVSCFDCHAANGHGGDNNYNLRTQITGTSDAPGILTFCGLCHKTTSYSSGNTGSDFADHSRGQHRDNAYSCRGCHAGQVDDDLDALSDNGGRFPQIMIHGGSFTWDSESETPGTSTDTFMFGGWLGGLDPVARQCYGGNCSHTTSAKTW